MITTQRKFQVKGKEILFCDSANKTKTLIDSVRFTGL